MSQEQQEIVDQIQNNEEEPQDDMDFVVFNINIRTPYNKTISLPVIESDSIHDIRQSLLETADTCFMTCYHLEFNDVEINDYMELSEIEGLTEDACLVMVEDPYTERQARTHVARLKELLLLPQDCKSFYSNIDDDAMGYNDRVSLKDYYPNTIKTIHCIEHITYSGWNPPPANRKLLGDLFYLDVTTVENDVFTVTAWTNGYFINQCKGNNFNPHIKDKALRSHCLVNLLEEVSLTFKQTFSSLINNFLSTATFENLPIPLPLAEWCVPKEEHKYDPTRAENALVDNAYVEYHIQGHSRDWNAELQVARDLPTETFGDRSMRDRELFRIHCDFVEHAMKGAMYMEVIDGNVPAINPSEATKAHMYIYNNIFYSHAFDNRDYFKDIGGDRAAYKSASNDLLGIKVFNNCDVEGLYTLCTVLVDYKGYRLIAQSIIPGLFSESNDENDIKLSYGSLDMYTVKFDENFHKILLDNGKKLNIKPHKVKDENGDVHELASHVEIKGIVGSDDRKYLLDMTHLTPRDANYPDPKYSTYIIRPELVTLYTLHKKEQLRKEMIENMTTDPETGDPIEPEDIDPSTVNVPTPEICFNTDLFTNVEIADDEETVAADTKEIEEISKFLMEDAIPRFLLECKLNMANPVDSDTLKDLMHVNGINMRYLGHIASKIEELNMPLYDICLRDMISRTFKHIFDTFMRNTTPTEVAKVVNKLLNAFFGKLTPFGRGSKSGLVINKPLVLDLNDVETINHNNLWSQIRKDIAEKYDYTLPELIPSHIFSIPMLRAICKRNGIQIAAKFYNLDNEAPFAENDILALVPVYKHSEPVAKDASQLLETARALYKRGRIDKTFDYLQDALQALHQVYGPMHRLTAFCYNELATLFNATGNDRQALEYREKSLQIYERILGFDNAETCKSYNYLSQHTEINGAKKTLNYCKRALYINNVICGEPSTTLSNILLNAGFLELEAGSSPEVGIRYLETALQHSIRINKTEENTHTASIYQALCIAYTRVGDWHQASVSQSKNYEILKVILGENDKQTQDSYVKLKALSKEAVTRVRNGSNKTVPKPALSNVQMAAGGKKKRRRNRRKKNKN